MTHPVLADHPDMRDHRAKQDELEDARRAHRDRVDETMTPYFEELKTWQARKDAALLNGEAPPPRPEPPDLGADEEAPHVFQRQWDTLRAERRRILARIARDVEEAAAARESELLSEVAELLEQLDPRVEEMQALLAAVREVRTARSDATFPSLAQRTRTTIDVHDLLDAARGNGSTLLDLAPSRPPSAQPPGQVVRVGERPSYGTVPTRRGTEI